MCTNLYIFKKCFRRRASSFIGVNLNTKVGAQSVAPSFSIRSSSRSFKKRGGNSRPPALGEFTPVHPFNSSRHESLFRCELRSVGATRKSSAMRSTSFSSFKATPIYACHGRTLRAVKRRGRIGDLCDLGMCTIRAATGHTRRVLRDVALHSC
jgi:hypothetical protein